MGEIKLTVLDITFQILTSNYYKTQSIKHYSTPSHEKTQSVKQIITNLKKAPPNFTKAPTKR